MTQYTFSLPQTFTISDEDITMIADNLMDEDTWYTWYLKDTDIFDFILHEVINIGECLDEDEVEEYMNKIAEQDTIDAICKAVREKIYKQKVEELREELGINWEVE